MAEKIFIEEYKGFKVFFEKKENQFIAEKEGLDLTFTSYSGIGRLREDICNSKIKAVNEDVIIIDGYSQRILFKIRVFTKDTRTNKFRYQLLDNTINRGGIENIKREDEIKKLYKLSEHNLQIFDEIKTLQCKIIEIEKEQKKLVNQLK